MRTNPGKRPVTYDVIFRIELYATCFMTISYLFPRMDSFSRTNQGWVSRAS